MEALGEAADEAVMADDAATRFLFIMDGGNAGGGGDRRIAGVVAMARRIDFVMMEGEEALKYIGGAGLCPSQASGRKTYRDGW